MFDCRSRLSADHCNDPPATVMSRPLVLCLLIASVLAHGSALAQSSGKTSGQQDSVGKKLLESYKAVPIAFYVAKGEPNSCGKGCDTWIAADGMIDFGASGRLKKFLAERSHQKLPIFFHSAGGSVDHAIEIGRILRQQEVRAGVARTTPNACASSQPRDKACEAVKRAGKVLEAQLGISGSCSSACVYALVGAKIRLIAPGSRLGVHASVANRIFSNGTVLIAPLRQLQDINARTKRYLIEMGIDPGLLEVALGTPNENIRYLTRDEIARFRIDTRELMETPCAASEASPGRFVVDKLLVLAREGRYLERSFNVTCAKDPTDYWFSYRRNRVADEVELSLVRIDFPGRAAVFGPRSVSNWGGGEARNALVSAAELEEAARSNEIAVVEEGRAANRNLKIPTMGLAEALKKLRASCDQGQADATAAANPVKSAVPKLTETAWTVREDWPGRFSVNKLLQLSAVQDTAGRRLLRTLHVSCAKDPEDFWISYRRIPNDVEVSLVRMEIPERPAIFQSRGARRLGENEERNVLVSANGLEEAARSKKSPLLKKDAAVPTAS
jgi:hypothetical protein